MKITVYDTLTDRIVTDEQISEWLEGPRADAPEWLESFVGLGFDGWDITEEGSLILLNGCGEFTYAPSHFRYELS